MRSWTKSIICMLLFFMSGCLLLLLGTPLAVSAATVSSQEIIPNSNQTSSKIINEALTPVRPAHNGTKVPSSRNATEQPASQNTELTPTTQKATGLSVQFNATAQTNTQEVTKQPTPSKTPDVQTPLSHNATQKTVPQSAPATPSALQNSTSKEGWIQVESGTRPVYVGIHGGTVPLSLVQAPDGALFAFAGETGSDFMNVLQGNTTTKKTPANATDSEQPTGNATLKITTAQEAPPATQPNQADTTGKQNVTQSLSAKTAAPLGTPMAASNKTATAPSLTPAQNIPMSSSAEKTNTQIAPATTQLKQKAPSNATKPQQQTGPAQAKAAKANAVKTPSAQQEAPVITSPTPVIASSGLATRLNQGNAELHPFGLSNAAEPDLVPEELLQPPKKTSPPLPRLRLESYKSILQLP